MLTFRRKVLDGDFAADFPAHRTDTLSQVLPFQNITCFIHAFSSVFHVTCLEPPPVAPQSLGRLVTRSCELITFCGITCCLAAPTTTPLSLTKHETKTPINHLLRQHYTAPFCCLFSPQPKILDQAIAAHVAASVTLLVGRESGFIHRAAHLATGVPVFTPLDRNATPPGLHQDGLECDGPP